MTLIINGDVAMRAIDRAVTARGYDYVYQDHYDTPENGACKYVVDGEAACIAGFAIIEELGLKWPTSPDDIPINGGFTGVYREVEELNDVKFTQDAVIVLSAAQGVQDSKGTWGLAKTVARKVIDAYSYFDIK